MSGGALVQCSLEQEYNKHTDISPEDIATLRKWIKTQPHLPEEHITDLELILIYYCCDRGLEASKQMVDRHYTLKTNLPDLFKDRAVDERIETVLDIILLAPLPMRTKEGNAVFYTRLLDCNPQRFVHLDALRAMIMAWEIWQYEEGTFPGVVMINDCAGMSFGHFYRLSMTGLQQFSRYLQEALLAHVKEFHVLNAPSYMDKLMSMCKPFVSKSLLDKVHIHPVNVEPKDLEQYFPVDALPKEVGGRWKSLQECKEETQAKLRASSEFFEAESKRRVDEEKRPGSAKKSGFLGGLTLFRR